MLPAVVSVKGLDMYRDGGSLFAEFYDPDRTMHRLVIWIDRSRYDLHSNRRYYKRCEMQVHHKKEYVSPVTGVSTPYTDQEDIAVTWEQAILLLDRIQDHIDTNQHEEKRIFSLMVKVAKTVDHVIVF